MRTGDVMSRPVVSVGPDARLRDVAATLVEHQINAVPVVDDGGRLVGIVSETTGSSRMGDDGTSSAGDDPPDAAAGR
jgi:CBS-domain-containing membrane protein